MDLLTGFIALRALGKIGECIDAEHERLENERREDEDGNDCRHCNRRRQREDDDDYECLHCGRIHRWEGYY